MAKKYMDFLGNTETKIIKDQSLLKYEEIKNKIQVLPSLKSFIPPLLTDEYAQLEENIKRDGCREALLVWETKQSVIDGDAPDNNEIVYVLIDGHNRFEICKKWNIDFKIHIVNYENIEKVKDFMIDNQLGRRNITPEQASYLRGLKYLNEKKNRGQYDRENQSGQNVHFEEKSTKKTAQRLAEQYNVNEKTIRRDADFAEGVELLPKHLKDEVLSGKSSLSKSEIIELGKTENLREIEMKVETLTERTKVEKKPDSKTKPVREKIVELIKKIDSIEDFDIILEEMKEYKKLLKKSLK